MLYIFWQPILDICFFRMWVAYILVPIHSTHVFLLLIFSYIESMWSLLHLLWVSFGGFYFSIHIYSIIIPCQIVNLQVSFKTVSQISVIHRAISWHFCPLFHRLYVIHISSFPLPWYVSFQFRLYIFIFCFVKMLMFCRLYVLIYFQILVLSPFKHSFC